MLKGSAEKESTMKILTWNLTWKSDADADSDADFYDEIKAAIMVEDWVGPISAALEVWHMVGDTPNRRQSPIVRAHYSYV